MKVPVLTFLSPRSTPGVPQEYPRSTPGVPQVGTSLRNEKELLSSKIQSCCTKDANNITFNLAIYHKKGEMVFHNFPLLTRLIFLLQALVSSAFSPMPITPLDQINGISNHDAEMFSRSLASGQRPGFLSSLTVSEETNSVSTISSNWKDVDPSQPVSKTAGEYILLAYVGFSVLAGCKEFIVRFRKWNENRREQ